MLKFKPDLKYENMWKNTVLCTEYFTALDLLDFWECNKTVFAKALCTS